MRLIKVDCSGVASEAEFWSRYVGAACPDDAEFGRNLDAFWDAVEGGGPGWPGEAQLIFEHAGSLAGFRDGDFLAALEKIMRDSTVTTITFTR